MQKRSAKKAIKDTLQIDLSENAAKELYLNICSFLLHKDDQCYIGVIRYKYLLLCGEISTSVSDYLVMEQLIEKMQAKHPLVLSALAYMARHKS